MGSEYGYSRAHGDGLMKYRLYQKNKPDKVKKYRDKMQKFYADANVAGSPLIVCCSVPTYDGRIAVPLAGAIYPENDGDDGVVDSIDPPASGE
jgi:hypothetical protein